MSWILTAIVVLLSGAFAALAYEFAKIKNRFDLYRENFRSIISEQNKELKKLINVVDDKHLALSGSPRYRIIHTSLGEYKDEAEKEGFCFKGHMHGDNELWVKEEVKCKFYAAGKLCV